MKKAKKTMVVFAIVFAIIAAAFAIYGIVSDNLTDTLANILWSCGTLCAVCLVSINPINIMGKKPTLSVISLVFNVVVGGLVLYMIWAPTELPEVFSNLTFTFALLDVLLCTIIGNIVKLGKSMLVLQIFEIILSLILIVFLCDLLWELDLVNSIFGDSLVVIAVVAILWLLCVIVLSAKGRSLMYEDKAEDKGDSVTISKAEYLSLKNQIATLQQELKKYKR